jgi:hypothetical protein
VEVLWEPAHRDPSEPQGDDREVVAEGSGERSCGPTNRNRMRGVAEQGERPIDRETLVGKAKLRISGGRATKLVTLTRGDLALRRRATHGECGARIQQRS